MAMSTALQLSAMSGLSTIESLPNEVIHLALSNLSLTDLKSFRLTSRALTHAPLEHIFKKVRILIHPRSVHIIRSIVGNGLIRNHVYTLSFDLRMVSHSLMGYNQWHNTCSEIGRRNFPDFANRMRGDYYNYVNFVECQHSVAVAGMAPLCSYFRALPHLQHLELNGGTDHGAMIPTAQDFADFDTIWPRIATVPHWRGNQMAERHVEAVLTAILSNPRSLQSLSLTGVNWTFLRSVSTFQRWQWSRGIRNIRHLKIHVRLPNPNPHSWEWTQGSGLIADGYANFLASPRRLETLDFGLIVEPNRNRRGMPWTWYGFENKIFEAILTRPSFMGQLEKLKFSEMVFSPNAFIRLLSHNESRTLKELSFHKIHLNEGSWLIFLRQLAQVADLDHFSLSSWISSEHEGWNALSQEEAAQYYGADDVERMHPHDRDEYDYDPDCLVECEGFGEWSTFMPLLPEKWCVRAQIEDWVTSGGGTRRTFVDCNDDDSPTKWAGWCHPPLSPLDEDYSPASTWHHDSFPLLNGYLPRCPIHHTPSPERQKQYRYESRWRCGLDRDFTFLFAEDLMEDARGGARKWQPCPIRVRDEEPSTEGCPGGLVGKDEGGGTVDEDEYVVPEEMVSESWKGEFGLVGEDKVLVGKVVKE